jgi:hypothetical protein
MPYACLHYSGGLGLEFALQKSKQNTRLSAMPQVLRKIKCSQWLIFANINFLFSFTIMFYVKEKKKKDLFSIFFQSYFDFNYKANKALTPILVVLFFFSCFFINNLLFVLMATRCFLTAILHFLSKPRG